jgi:hypothetical protein
MQANQRSCLPCTACCEGWLDISEGDIQAHIGQPCNQCSSSGCKVYSTRPVNPCQNFFCAWRQEGTPLNEHMRPDLSGVIVIMDRIVWRDEKVIVGIPVGDHIPSKSLSYLQSLSNLTQLNLLTVSFVMNEDKFTSASRLSAYGDSDFIDDMKNRFADGVLSW